MKTKSIFLTLLFLLSLHFLKAQTVPVTFHFDANNSQIQSVQMWHWPNYIDFSDGDSDRIFELTMELEEGVFNYHILRDNGWGSDPHNPLLDSPYPTSGVRMLVSDPMISYLLPKDGDIMRKNRIRADFAYTSDNPPLAGTMLVSINENAISNPESFYNAEKRILLINNPSHLIEGDNVVTVSYETNKGAISRSSAFRYHSIELMTDTTVYRMENILAWGRIMNTPYPDKVFVQCNNQVYEANVNSEGYFGENVLIEDGNNTIKVARTEAELSSPIDQMTLQAELRHKWWVELMGSISGNSATVSAVARDVDQSELTIAWSENADNPQSIGIGGSATSVSFTIPETEGEYILQLDVSDSKGMAYTARKMLIVKEGTTRFLGIHERAPWMETMAIYEVEQNYLDHFTFEGLKSMLPHIKKLGLNAFRVAPFNIGGFIAYDHFDIFPEYGTKEDLQDLIATAHQYDIRVFFDIPFSHICPYHPFLYPNFLVENTESPYYNFNLWEGTPGESDIIHSPDNGRQCVYTNLDNAYTQEYFYKLVEYWVEVFGADGFRIDCGQESFLRSPEFATTVLKRLRNINPNLFILNEGDNRDHPDVDYYSFGDAAYDWKLNSQWGAADRGFPGLFKGTYTTDQLHELLTTGTPENGLVLRYANCGYFEYFHDLVGWEQERTAFAIVSTSYGLPNVFQGEEVGAQRANGSFDYSDPLNKMPWYTRLIKARQSLLGNYPEIKRLSLANGNQIYAYTSKNEEQLVLTIANFTANSNTAVINFSDEAFYGIEIEKWFEITKEQSSIFDSETSVTVNLNAWETKIFAINIEQSELFSSIEELQIISLDNSFEITEDGGSLSFIAQISPQNSMGEVEWSLEGDADLATITNGILKACGCGQGEVVVIARSVENPEIADRKTVIIHNQISGQVNNSSFDDNLNDWFLWTPECDNTLVWENGEAKINIGNNGSDCWSQFMNQDNMTIEQGKSYRLSFDAYASVPNSIFCVVRKNGDNWASLSPELKFELSTTKQTFSYTFTMSQPTSSIGQIHFNFGGNNEVIAIDNVRFCEFDTEACMVTFQVNMYDEEVDSGVGITGDWLDWSSVVPLDKNGSIYSASIELSQNAYYEYKFVKIDAGSAITEWEEISGACVANGNRFLNTATSELVLDPVCFSSCSICLNTAIDEVAFENGISIFPNPVKDYISFEHPNISGDIELNIYSAIGTLLRSVPIHSKHSFRMNVSDLETGVYYLQIKNAESEYRGKFIKL